MRIINRDPKSGQKNEFILDKEVDQIVKCVAEGEELNGKMLPSSFRIPCNHGRWVIDESDKGKLIIRNDNWTEKDENFLGVIAEHLQAMYFLKDEVVCSPGDKCDKLYFIYSGEFYLHVQYPESAELQEEETDEECLYALERRHTAASFMIKPSAKWRNSFFGCTRQVSQGRSRSSSPKLQSQKPPGGKNDKMFSLQRGDIFGHVALFKTHCFKGTIIATAPDCVVRYITVENLRHILWNLQAGAPQEPQQREAKRFFENLVDIDYRRWFKGAFEGVSALNPEK